MLTNDTTLLWTHGDDLELAGYEVVWRPTINPFWTHVIPVGDVSRATVGLSKDNVVFGVRSAGTVSAARRSSRSPPPDLSVPD